MAPDNEDRTVHAEIETMDGDHCSVVRYNKQGHWYWESVGTSGDIERGISPTKAKRKHITLSEAIALTLQAHHSAHGQWFRGRPGGRTLDARVLAAIANRKGHR